MPHIDWTAVSTSAWTTAAVAFAGLLVTLASALFAARDTSGKLQTAPAIFAVLGMLAGGGAIAIQLKATRNSEKLADCRYKKLQEAEKLVGQSATNVDVLVALNALSPDGRYHVRLSVSPTAAIACASAKRIDAQFPGAISSKGVRVLNSGKGSQPFILVFGNDLTLAGAEIYQRLAIDHSLANGLPPIDQENPSEPVFNCDSIH